jgi:hypothetical protein
MNYFGLSQNECLKIKWLHTTTHLKFRGVNTRVVWRLGSPVTVNISMSHYVFMPGNFSMYSINVHLFSKPNSCDLLQFVQYTLQFTFFKLDVLALLTCTDLKREESKCTETYGTNKWITRKSSCVWRNTVTMCWQV